MATTLASRAESPPESDPGRTAAHEHLQHLADSAQTVLRADAVLIAARLSRGSESTPVASGIPVELGMTILSVLEPLIADREVLKVADVAGDARTSALLDWGSLDVTSLLSAPLQWEGEELGTILAIGQGELCTPKDANERIMALANQTALAVAYARLSKKHTSLSEEIENLAILDEVVLAASSIEEMGRELTGRLAVLGAKTSGIMVLDEERQILQLLPGGFGADSDATASYRVRVDNPVSNSARVFSTGEPYLSNGAEGDPGIMQDYVDLFHVKRLLSVPLSLAGKRIGVLHLANKEAPFTPNDVHRAQMLAPRFATVVELGTTVLRLRRHQRATELLVDLAVGIASGKEIFELMSTAFERLGDVIGTDLLALVPPNGAPMVWRRSRLPADVEERLLEEAIDRPSVRPEIGEPRRAGDPGHATLFVPVRLAGKRIATIATLRQRAEPFVATERNVVARLANLAAVGWATENYQRQRAEVAMLRERQRIADDLHDTVAQIMFAAQLDLDSALEVSAVDPGTSGKLIHARSLLLRGDAEIRNVIHQLSRPIRGDLSQRLGLLVESLEQEFNIGIRLEIPPPVAEAAKGLRRSVADALVKTAQEAIINAAKHAGPCSISVRLGISRRERLVLTIVDDGIGRSGASDKGYGLASVRRSLRDCGGLLQVRLPASGGTRVLASVSL
jgi:signal transduction histidine kinase